MSGAELFTVPRLSKVWSGSEHSFACFQRLLLISAFPVLPTTSPDFYRWRVEEWGFRGLYPEDQISHFFLNEIFFGTWESGQITYFSFSPQTCQ